MDKVTFHTNIEHPPAKQYAAELRVNISCVVGDTVAALTSNNVQGGRRIITNVIETLATCTLPEFH